MTLGILFQVGADSWEEGLAAAFYLTGQTPQGGLAADSYRRIAELLTHLQALPAAWGRELCLDTLLPAVALPQAEETATEQPRVPAFLQAVNTAQLMVRL